MDEYGNKKNNSIIGIIVIVFIVLGVGLGGFYLYKNREKLEITLPWDEKAKEKKKKNDAEKEDAALKLGTVEVIDKQVGIGSDLLASVNNLQEDDKGITFDVYFKDTSKHANFECEIFKVLVDNYDTSETAKFSLQPGEQTKLTLRILRTDLDAQDIARFKDVAIYLNITKTDEDKVTEKEGLLTFNVHQEIAVNNEKKGLELIDEKNNTSISYYQLKEDKDNHYIYFLLNNKRTASSSTIYVKKLTINNKSYPLPDFKEDIFKGARRCFYIKIPKKDFKNIDQFTVSFFIITGADKLQQESYYITKEYTKTFAKE